MDSGAIAAVAAAAAVGSAVGSVLTGVWQRSTARQALSQQRLDRDAADRQHHLDQVLSRYQAALTGLGSTSPVARELALQELRALAADATAGVYRAAAGGVLDSELIAAIGEVSELLASGQTVDVVVDDEPH